MLTMSVAPESATTVVRVSAPRTWPVDPLDDYIIGGHAGLTTTAAIRNCQRHAYEAMTLYRERLAMKSADQG